MTLVALRRESLFRDVARQTAGFQRYADPKGMVDGTEQVMGQIADDLAKQGFLAVCPDLFWRFEPGLQLSDHKESDLKKGLEFYGRYADANRLARLTPRLRSIFG